MQKYELEVFSIFDSISGEVGLVPQGTTVRFLRLSKCNLKCSYCDAKETWGPGEKFAVSDLVTFLSGAGAGKGMLRPKHLIITGGEPLLQQAQLRPLLKTLKSLCIFETISIETNGTIVPSIEDIVDCFIFDIKSPNNDLEPDKEPRPNPAILGAIKKPCWFKGVVLYYQDFQAILAMADHIKSCRRYLVDESDPNFFQFALSAADPLHPATLYRWMQEAGVDAVLNIQIHKIIWPAGEQGDKSL